MTERVSFKSANGESVDGALALPAADKAPTVVVLQEWWGLNDQIKSIAVRLAKEGFVAVVPDLYHGKLAKDSTEAGALMQSLDWGRAMQDIAGAVAYARTHPRGNGKVAVIGFCMGGALTLAAAANIRGLAAAVPYYGVPGAQDWSKIDVPIQAHFAQHDDWATVGKAEDVKHKVEQAGGRMELFVYDAQHAFCNDQRPEVYSPDNCAKAWERTIAFLRANVS